jgi:Fe-S cluster biogenesis protein NfuA
MSEENKVLEIYVQPTPNPNALKFVLNMPVVIDGRSSSYRSPMDCQHNDLACALFTIRGVDQLHFYDNTVTITKFGYEEWEAIETTIEDCLKDKMQSHDPDYKDPNPEAERRESLSPELLQIEEIIDKTIRPGLQGDGGDIQCLTYEDSTLVVRYQGACGTCPSSTTGTLEAIKQILRDQFNPEIDVFIAPF